MKLLLHICCAPCSVECIKSLRAEGIEPTGYWYNPNIHPFTEYRARRNTVTEYAQSIGLALEMNDFYGLRPFCAAVAEDIGGRCAVCYACRMRETARYAALQGFTHFSTTLLYSPYQKHELLRAAAEEAAEEFGVEFLYRDFRPLFRQGQEEARARPSNGYHGTVLRGSVDRVYEIFKGPGRGALFCRLRGRAGRYFGDGGSAD